MNDDAPIWIPSAERVSAAQLTKFHAFARDRGAPGGDYSSLWQWSVDEPAAFWSAVFDFAGVIADRGPGPVLRDGDRMPGATWFEGTRLNFAENLLRGTGNGPAVIARDERGRRREMSWDQLRAEVARVADGLRAAGVVAGDRVAGFMPNLPEAIVAMLATTSLGATWSSCSPDFGIRGVIDRFGQIAPKVLFTADGYSYGGKTLDSIERLAGILAGLPSVTHVVVVANVSPRPDLARLPAALHYEEFGQTDASLRFERMPFDHPLYILYSSGTTGVPKCIVHGAGGTLLQHLKEHQLHSDVHPGERLFFFTTCGWMMWNWLASALASQATVVLFDGSPFHPDEGVLWRLASEERVACFGTSPKYLAALEKSGYRPAGQVDLANLRTVLSTGSPLAHEQFDFVRNAIGADIQLASISGGTDIVSCFALGNPTLPVYRGELQCRGLGMRVEVFDDDGRPLQGQQGELVCTAPFPSMPVGFWNDSRWQPVPRGVFRALPERLVSRRLRGADRARRARDPGTFRRRAESRRRAYRHRRNLSASREAAGGPREHRDRPALGQRRARRAVRAAASRRHARRGARKANPGRDSRQHDAATRAGQDRRSRRHPAHDQRQDRRARGPRGRAWPAGQEHGCAREPGSARRVPGPAGAARLKRDA